MFTTITVIETRHTSMVDRKLAAAAFGDRPGSWPLPTATTPQQLWLRAVAAGGQGRYGSAYRDLAELRRSGPAGRLVSLAHSTEASFLRQLGWHALARGRDGRALARAGADPEARADALIGLAADALGVGRFAAAATLLTRADSVLAPATVPDRLPRRPRRVRGGLERAARAGAKSEVVRAAALCSAGRTERARGIAETALNATERLGLIPLRWALACLLIDIGSVTFAAQDLPEIRDVCAARVRRAGGTWRSA